ncbi:Nif3-like dinuclear metal center hexameric protein [Catenovulum sp. 2E275]|uniref:Nif3-like dinuclear metal center hexameric protein n=1 Tax=Catenovulum sp. 2E275 TaxID=2980497 RepID=UPI0021D27BC3|nr:Nif3-like dinuclear metal center hexameric protein [Catenovulum sp. 2E275]MCU4676177.1 Nif3-like dinuclear metal center hexameric protein [Catenovulum sp. 2E275]
MNHFALENYLNSLLKPEKIRDFCPNGLQVEGKSEVKKIITGVTATQLLIDEAINRQADAIFVHHGFFWKNENPVIKGMKQKRIKALLANDINLYAYHLPLDIHPQLGNNAQLAKLFDIEITGGLELDNPFSVAMQGKLTQALSLNEFAQKVETKLARKPLVEAGGDFEIKTVAWCSGGGQSFIEQAAAQDIDLFISGEVSEQTIHTAREMGIHFMAAGHHATERYGAKAVGEHLAAELGLTVEFVDIDNPA